MPGRDYWKKRMAAMEEQSHKKESNTLNLPRSSFTGLRGISTGRLPSGMESWQIITALVILRQESYFVKMNLKNFTGALRNTLKRENCQTIQISGMKN